MKGIRMRFAQWPLLWIPILLLAAACGDDDPVKPEEFALTIHVTDPAGKPVEGLRAGLLNDHDYLQDAAQYGKTAGAAPYSAAVVIPYNIPDVARTCLTIEDIEGGLVRHLQSGTVPIGSHLIRWDGRSDTGELQPSGRYTAHLVAMDLDTGETIFEDRVDMLLSMADASRVPAGFTGADGRLVLHDRKLLPHLYERPAMTATQAEGSPIGPLELTSMMRISLADTTGGGSMHFKMEIPGPATLELVWDPPLGIDDMDREASFPGVSILRNDPPSTFKLGLAYPNPFN